MERSYIKGLLILCVITTILSAQDVNPQAVAQAIHMTPSAVALAESGGVEITLLQVDMARRHLVFQVSGREVTSVTATRPLRLAFDVPIVRVELLEVPRTMRMDSLILDQVATFSLTRGPFMLPQAWACMVMIEFTALPNIGYMRIGTGDIQPVTYTLTPARQHSDPARTAS